MVLCVGAQSCIYISYVGTKNMRERSGSLSGRVLDSRPRGCRFKPHRRRCVVSLEQEH